MRQFILILFFCIICVTNIANAMTTKEYVNHLEKTLFGTTYGNLPVNERIDKIEKQIYDNCYAGTPEERLEKIDKIYPKADFETKKNPAKNKFSQTNNNLQKIYPTEKADYNNYPVVSEIEQKIYNKNYQGEDIYKRLARIEKELYGMEKSEQSLQERVANLKSILPAKKETPFGEQKYKAENFNFEKANNSFDSLITIKELEKRTFNRTFDNDNPNKRIERLEQFYFGKTNVDTEQEERLMRLASVAVAPSVKNKYYPNMNSIEWTNLLINLLFIGLGFLL